METRFVVRAVVRNSIIVVVASCFFDGGFSTFASIFAGMLASFAYNVYTDCKIIEATLVPIVKTMGKRNALISFFVFSAIIIFFSAGVAALIADYLARLFEVSANLTMLVPAACFCYIGYRLDKTNVLNYEAQLPLTGK